MHSLYIDCDFPKWMHYTLIAYASSLIVLFTNFYIHAYCKRRMSKAASQRKQTEDSNIVANGNPNGIPVANSNSEMEVKKTD